MSSATANLTGHRKNAGKQTEGQETVEIIAVRALTIQEVSEWKTKLSRASIEVQAPLSAATAR